MNLRFQQTCDTLDGLLANDRPQLESQHITITDCSYFGNREPLAWWSYAFELRWTVPPFVVRLSVHLTAVEPLPDEDASPISMTRLAEVFQIGAGSQVHNQHEEAVALDEVVTEGLGGLVSRTLAEARASLPTAYRTGETTNSVD